MPFPPLLSTSQSVNFRVAFCVSCCVAGRTVNSTFHDSSLKANNPAPPTPAGLVTKFSLAHYRRIVRFHFHKSLSTTQSQGVCLSLEEAQDQRGFSTAHSQTKMVWKNPCRSFPVPRLPCDAKDDLPAKRATILGNKRS